MFRECFLDVVGNVFVKKKTNNCDDIRMIRQGQKLSVPIIMTPERNVSLAFWTAILPIGIYTILDRSVFEPKRKKNRAL